MTQIVSLLIIEDDDFDFEIMKQTLSTMGVSNPLIRAKNGIEALNLLRGEDGHAALSKPYLIFLDLNMPRMGGMDVLKEIRADKDLENSTVFIFTSSESDEDILNADKYNVAGFILKSDIEGSLREAVQSLGFSWCIVAD
ncbi:response regulator receiver domain-containing protein [Litorimonas taeanensis]|uniref:Response regulator receiver domain-containing protein n=1 Tax=Litorimonas taeanensis TaxID=568099 RepID=A0A420WDZ7_9PROT|nr:response regulator [Litorimonas taeanensis]RKQ69223.1 response regulator receiver domain-containing protein [Litorimonas taeanensis]